MGKLLKVTMIKNKKNGQINLSIPKRKLDVDMRNSICKYKTAWINLERLE